MKTPIVDFIRDYRESETACFHMPGHKGHALLGPEYWDITEIHGADDLYHADGIIRQSEENAAALFGSGATFYSAEGSSQCIRAMVCLALQCRADGASPLILAARNVHKSFVYAAAMLDAPVRWLYPEERSSICACPISPAALERELTALPCPPAAVYVTSPDYLGNRADISGLAQVCHDHGTILAVDNAHGAYLHFLQPAAHPLDLGADLCCDSAHKTLPVLTGGAYLHLGKHLPAHWRGSARQALALFGSTSPSYVILASLDRCNAYLADGYPEKLAQWTAKMEQTRQDLRHLGWQVEDSDPLRLTICGVRDHSGEDLAEHLRGCGMECEYADRDYLVLMMTPENDDAQLLRLTEALSQIDPIPIRHEPLPIIPGEPATSIREAVFGRSQCIRSDEAIGRICAAPLVACPPAIPIVLSGERITEQSIYLLHRYGQETVQVLCPA